MFLKMYCTWNCQSVCVTFSSDTDHSNLSDETKWCQFWYKSEMMPCPKSPPRLLLVANQRELCCDSRNEQIKQNYRSTLYLHMYIMLFLVKERVDIVPHKICIVHFWKWVKRNLVMTHWTTNQKIAAVLFFHKQGQIFEKQEIQVPKNTSRFTSLKNRFTHLWVHLIKK